MANETTIDTTDRPGPLFPALAALQLHEGDLQRLRRQGFVRAETHHGRIRFKLCYRDEGGRQRVRNLGPSPQVADAVRWELATLQSRRTAMRTLAAASRNARCALRDAKRRLMPFVLAEGLVFHGRTVRCPRTPK